GLLRPDELRTLTDIELPEAPRLYETVAGLVLYRLGRIPEVGDAVTVDGVRLEVERMDGRRIDELRLLRTEPPAEDGSEAPTGRRWQALDSLVPLLVGLVLLLGNAFFVGASFALVSVRKSQIEPLAKGGSRAARSTLRALSRVSLMMAGAQLGITI